MARWTVAGSDQRLTRGSAAGNVAMSRVKFNAKQEYEYLENFKVLQKCFNQNKVEKVGAASMASVLVHTPDSYTPLPTCQTGADHQSPYPSIGS
jgi:hypothetical protein